MAARLPIFGVEHLRRCSGWALLPFLAGVFLFLTELRLFEPTVAPSALPSAAPAASAASGAEGLGDASLAALLRSRRDLKSGAVLIAFCSQNMLRLLGHFLCNLRELGLERHSPSLPRTVQAFGPF